MRVATEHRADATQRETKRALTAGSEKGVSRLFKEAVCLATNPLGLGSSPPGAAAAAVKQKKRLAERTRRLACAVGRWRQSEQFVSGEHLIA